MIEGSKLPNFQSGKSELNQNSCGLLQELLTEAISGAVSTIAPPLISPVLLLKAAAKVGKTGIQDMISVTEDCVTIHEYQFIKIEHALTSGSQYNLATQIDHEKSRGMPFGFECEIMNGENQLCVSTRTTLRNLNKTEMYRLQGVLMPEKQSLEIANWVQSIPLTQELVNRYLKLSGDTNPIHCNPEFASSLGLSGALIPGMLIAGIVDLVLERQQPCSVINELRIRFMAPAAVGSVVSFGVLDRGNTGIPDQFRARVFAKAPDDTILFIADILFSKATILDLSIPN